MHNITYRGKVAMLVLLALFFIGVFAFLAVSPKELAQTLLAGAWIAMALMAVGSFVAAIAR